MRKTKIIFAALLVIIVTFFARTTHQPTYMSFSVMTFNIENGGTQIDFNKVVEAIKKANADVVGLQEAWGNTSRLANALHWPYYNNRQHIVSRYPLLETTDSDHRYLLVEVKPGYVVAIANMHLPDDPYGPDRVKQGAKAAEVEKMERRVRLPTALPYIKKLATQAQHGVPVFLTGDFNSPSHLDWQQRPTPVRWPVTNTIEAHGLLDAYHTIHPQSGAVTWPSGRPVAKNSFDGFNPSAKDLPDRLDFIFNGGKSKALAATIAGEPSYRMAGVTVSPWPSDHRAVVARFEIIPAPVSDFHLTASSNKLINTEKPTISTNKRQYKPNEAITIQWHNTPGSRFDYIMIAPSGSKKTGWGEAVRLYTHGQANGSVIYNKASSKGNWMAWHIGNEGHWPLKAGNYDVRLMLDDGYVELAKTHLIIKNK